MQQQKEVYEKELETCRLDYETLKTTLNQYILIDNEDTLDSLLKKMDDALSSSDLEQCQKVLGELNELSKTLAENTERIVEERWQEISSSENISFVGNEADIYKTQQTTIQSLMEEKNIKRLMSK